MTSKKISLIVFLAFALFTGAVTTSCGAYSFSGASVPDSIKTIRVNFIENKARYVNPQLSPRLTDKFKQKINSQTRLTQTNNENAHYVIDAYVGDYSVSTSGLSNQQASNNRLTVAIHISLTNTLAGKTEEHDVSRSYEFSANTSFQAAQNALMDNMVRDLTDDIFNRVFSNW